MSTSVSWRLILDPAREEEVPERSSGGAGPLSMPKLTFEELSVDFAAPGMGALPLERNVTTEKACRFGTVLSVSFLLRLGRKCIVQSQLFGCTGNRGMNSYEFPEGVGRNIWPR